MPLVFAYGSNMDTTAMARRCPRSTPVGLARLERHRLAIMREGWLTVVRAPRGAVHGLLWDLALADLSALDRYEGLHAGLYAKVVQPVVTGAGAKRAIVYVGADAGPGVAKSDYLAAVLAAARAAGLPAEGVAALEALGQGGSPEPAVRRPLPRAPLSTLD
ncbi:gamma-glutamyl AIG2-like cyclotransferase [Roseiarcus fermentans]|uniref:Gamma-glutamyl AIG2-like cyclotransferase n=1 Tax=Roseiarcus fermentans TaxID=1473586 RepID=A0A366FNW1_9HYPH|nr:gamma-glutamylcyclotransferase family protein [Roseiarcus fermentans]RBP15740.1 gamma-glutamyl AIG2-like cyclotransferase [Roseiarcus fermentans]